MGIFNRTLTLFKKPIEKRSIPELIETIAHIDPMNSDGIKEDCEFHKLAKKFPVIFGGSIGDNRVWMNPNNQTSFESGWLEHQDFIDWANGTGKVVRGETQEQKDKFMRYARAQNELDSYSFMYIKYLNLIDSESKAKLRWKHHSTPYTKALNLSKRRDSAEVIKEVFSTLVPRLLVDIKEQAEWRKHDPDWVGKLRCKHTEYMHAVCDTLTIGGHGYFEACNTPCEIENLSWSRDLVWSKAYCMYLEEIDPGLIDCIKWCDDNRHKIKAT
jgi:hypothetical protein